VIVWLWRMRCGYDQTHLDHLLNGQADWQRTVDLHALDFRDLAMFGQSHSSSSTSSSCSSSAMEKTSCDAILP